MMTPLTSRKRAFTLIELLIVITIIGILAVALIPRLTGGPARARDAQRKADLQTIATALEFYADDDGMYPPSSYCLSSNVFQAFIKPYLTKIPSDPTGLMASFAGASTPCTSATADYAYMSLNSGEGYLLIADLETETDEDEGAYNSTFSVDTTATAASNFSVNSAKACSEISTGCTEAILVVGR